MTFIKTKKSAPFTEADSLLAQLDSNQHTQNQNL